MDSLVDLERRLNADMRQLAPEPSWGFVDRVNGLVDATAQRRTGLLRLPTGRSFEFGWGRAAAAALLLLALVAASIGLAVVASRPSPAPPDSQSLSVQGIALPMAGTDGMGWVADALEFNDQFIAVGLAPADDGWGNSNDNGLIWASPDGVTWRQVLEIPGAAGANVNGIATDGTKLVAVGSRADGDPQASVWQGMIWISSDGVNWEQVPAGAEAFTSVVYEYGTFVAVRSDAIGEGPYSLWTSTDGRQWLDTGVHDVMPGRLRATPAGILWVGGGGYRPGDVGSSVVSHDGATWEHAARQQDLVNMSLTDVGWSEATGLVAIGAYDSENPQTGVGWWILRGDGLTWQLDRFLDSFAHGLTFGFVQGAPDLAIVQDGQPVPVLLGPDDGPALDDGPVAEGTRTSSVIDAVVTTDGRYLLMGNDNDPTDGSVAPMIWIGAR